MKYTIKDFQTDFPDDNACLEWLKDYLYPEGIFCPNDKKITPHHKLSKRKAYSCELCGHHTYPTANTIFHKSSTPLTLWFYAVYLMSSTRAGISAKQLERELGVTYKTAWRMFHQIRKMMADDSNKLDGDVEIDEMYLGANPRKRTSVKAGEGETVFGAVQRGGRVKVTHIEQARADVLIDRVHKDVDKTAQVYSDGLMAYRTLYNTGWKHKSVNHVLEYVDKKDPSIHTNNIENVWSNMKRGIKGVYRHVDAQYLQAYLDEYSFRYSRRNDYQPMFWAIMRKVTK